MEYENRQKLNETLRLLRVYHDLSRADIVENLGISKSYLSEIESGAKNVSLDLVNRYAEFFDIKPSGILFVGESLAKGNFAKSFEKSFGGKVRSLMTWISDVDAAKGEGIEKV